MANPMEIPAPLSPQERQGVLPMRQRNGTRTRGIQQGIIEFLQDHPTKEFSTDSIALQTTLPRQSVQSAMSKLVNQGLVKNGSVRGLYQYAGPDDDNPSAVNIGDTLEVVRVREDADLVLIDRHGTIYLATRVDI